MRKVFFVLMILIISQISIVQETLAEKEPPDYAKWGNIAVTETIKKYPQADVVDYLHIGREEKDKTTAVEKFKLWLRQDEKEFGVYVNVEFDKNTKQFKGISFKETDR